MNIENSNKNILIKLYKQKTKNFDLILNQTRNNIILKKKPLLRAKTNFYNVNSEENEEKSPENSKLFLENKELDNRLILPTLLNTSNHSKIALNTSVINTLDNNMAKQRKKYIVKLKKIKIKKQKNIDSLTPTYQNKSLINLYNENFHLKKKFEHYKIKKEGNMQNFSYEKYNLNLLKLSSISLSQDSYNTFKKNMQIIESNMKGQRIKRKNRWLIFLDRIGNFAPEGLKKKIISLSEHKYQEQSSN